MKIRVVTLFVDQVRAVVGSGVVGRAAADGVIDLRCINPRDFVDNSQRRVDDRPYGGGPGMVMQYEPMVAAIRHARAGTDAPVIGLSPQGRPFTQLDAQRLAELPGFVLVAGRYEGIDERVAAAEFDEEISLGDFVLSGGEIPAMAIVDAVTRLLPGVLGAADSAEQDSFSDGLLDCQHYTRPDEVEGRAVPRVLLSGDHAAIDRWRRKQSLGRTWQRRPDLLESAKLSGEDLRLLEEYMTESRIGDSH